LRASPAWSHPGLSGASRIAERGTGASSLRGRQHGRRLRRSGDNDGYDDVVVGSSGESSNSTAASGGGLAVLGGTVTLTTTQVSGNTSTSTTASAGGGGWYESGGTLNTPVVQGNVAAVSGGGVYQSTGSLECVASTSASDGFFSNRAGSGGAVYLPSPATFRSTVCGFGTAAPTNNGPTDALDGTHTYNYGNFASFYCSGGTCR